VAVPQPDLDNSNAAEDDIDAALTDLQVSLEGSSLSNTSDIHKIPELQDELRLFKYKSIVSHMRLKAYCCLAQLFRPRKFSLKNYKKFFFVLRDTQLTLYKSQEESNEPPVLRINIRGEYATAVCNPIALRASLAGCEATPDINISARKYNMKIFVPSSEGLVEY
jgi:kindlin 2